MNIVAKGAMVLSMIYYVLGFSYVWFGQLFGLHNYVWDIFDLPRQDVSPPIWTLLVGLAISVIVVVSLWMAFAAVWRILNGGTGQDFRDLGANLRRLAAGLFGYWFAFNVITAGLLFLIVVDLPDVDGFEFGWDPIESDIVFLIMAIAIYAISRTLDRAWQAEEENRLFL
ncbi:MAG: hypothetical protein Q9M48_12500 [Rhodobacterales bacterium]|nr:hypothetical protein [Rhodobacterales bacterium]